MRLPINRPSLIVIIGLLFILSLNFWQKDAKGFFYFISEPFQKRLWGAGGDSSDFLKGFFLSGNLKRERDELKLKIQELLAKQSALEELEKENKTLREVLGLGFQKEFKIELADVIGRDTGQDAVFIDKGAEDGLAKGMPLVTPQKVFIGSVIETYQRSSKVMFVSDKKSQLQAEISGKNISGLLKGAGGSGAVLDLIPKESEIQEGDTVIFRGFLVGTVKKVEKIDIKPFQQAEISLFLDVPLLDKAFIILNF